MAAVLPWSNRPKQTKCEEEQKAMGHNKPDRNENLRVRKKAETTGRNRELKTRPNPHDQSKTLHNKNKCLPVCGSETKRPTKYQKGLETRNYQPVAPFPGVNTSIVKKALCNERGRVDVDISAQNYSTINGMHPPKQQIRGHEPVKDCRQNSSGEQHQHATPVNSHHKRVHCA